MATNNPSKQPATTLRCGNIGECQREGPVLRHDLFPLVQGQSGAWCSGTSFGLHDLEALMNVAFEAKE